MASAGEYTVNNSTWTVIYDPEVDGIASTIMSYAVANMEYRVENLHHDQYSGDAYLWKYDSDTPPIYFSHGPRGIGKVYAKSGKTATATVWVAIVSKVLS